MSHDHYYSNEELIVRIQESTGLTHREAQVALVSTIIAIRDQLLEGREVVLRNLGTLYFRMAAARSLPERRFTNGAVIPELHLPARPVIKFKVANELRVKVAGIKVEKLRRAVPWPGPLKDRLARPTPSPNPTPATPASPSSQALAGEATLE